MQMCIRDRVETMLMSLFYEGRFYSFSPHTYLDRMDLTVIRPFLFVTEADIVGFKNKYQLPVCKNPCPMDGYTKRQYIKDLIKELQKDNPQMCIRDSCHTVHNQCSCQDSPCQIPDAC